MRKEKMMMSFQPKQMSDNVFQLYIYDDVTAEQRLDRKNWEYLDSETSSEWFKNQLALIPENAQIELFVNSNGGSVKEGVGIYNQLVRHQSQKTAYIDGVAYSVAFLICMACQKIVMGLGTSALIHNMWVMTEGNAEQLRKTADDLDNMMISNRQIFLKRSGGKISEEQLIEISEAEKILTPDECLAFGLIDEIAETFGNIDQIEIQQKQHLEFQQSYIKQQQRFVQDLKMLQKEGSKQPEQKKELQKNKEPKQAFEAFFSQFIN